MTTEITNPTTCQIDGTTYEIVKRSTREDEIADGHFNSAKNMAELKQSALLFIKKPKGSVVFFTVEFESGQILSNPARLGRW